MSVTGKGSLSIRKQDVREQKNLTVGFKKLTFAHKATLGDTRIDLSSLVIPTEMSGLGFTNPTTAELLATQLYFYRKNLILTSSIRGPLMDYLSYDVSTSSRISFSSFTAAAGEIFIGTIDYNARNGYPIVDAAPLVSTGTLAIGVADYNVGQAFEVNKYSSSQVGAVVVYRNGIQQFRNTNNSSVTLDGNYYEVNNGSGLAQIIRFNVAPVTTASILVVSNGLLAYNPDGSALQQIETLAGQIDAIIPTLAILASVPTSTFQAAPNNVDLKTFGGTVSTNTSGIAALYVALNAITPVTFTTGTALVNATTFTIAHGLGHVPVALNPSLLVSTAVAGWSVGDEIFRWVDGLTAIADTAIFVGADATNIIIRVNDVNAAIFNKSTGANTAAAVTNFKLRVRAI